MSHDPVKKHNIGSILALKSLLMHRNDSTQVNSGFHPVAMAIREIQDTEKVVYHFRSSQLKETNNQSQTYIRMTAYSFRGKTYGLMLDHRQLRCLKAIATLLHNQATCVGRGSNRSDKCSVHLRHFGMRCL